MAYGDITGSPHSYRAPSKGGTETVRHAVVLKDSSTIGSAAIDYTNNLLDLSELTAVKDAYNNAGLYIGTAGNILVTLSGQQKIIETGSDTAGTSNKLTDSTQNFSSTVQARDVVVNTTDGTVAFVGAVDSNTALSLVDASNSASNIMASGEKYEIHRPVLFQNVAAGSILPVEVYRVWALATTTTDIMLLYQVMPKIGTKIHATWIYPTSVVIGGDMEIGGVPLTADRTFDPFADSTLFKADATQM